MNRWPPELIGNSLVGRVGISVADTVMSFLQDIEMVSGVEEYLLMMTCLLSSPEVASLQEVLMCLLPYRKTLLLGQIPRKLEGIEIVIDEVKVTIIVSVDPGCWRGRIEF